VIARIVNHFAAHFGQQATVFVGFGNKTNELGLFGGDLHRDISMVEGLKKVKEIVRRCELSRTIVAWSHPLLVFGFIAKLASSLSYWIATADRTAN
jgi:hypothetical protein